MSPKAVSTGKSRAIDLKRDIDMVTAPQTAELLADLKNKVAAQLEVSLQGTSHFVVGTQWSSDSRRLSVKVDGDRGVNIDVCASLNRSLGKLIDEHGWQGSVLLEVGSPGAEAPLIIARQYPQHINRQFKIALINGSVIMGNLVEADATKVVLKGQDHTEICINFRDIKEARVVIS